MIEDDYHVNDYDILESGQRSRFRVKTRKNFVKLTNAIAEMMVISRWLTRLPGPEESG